MDVTPLAWTHQLHKILHEISQADFVALDFELSGISSKNFHRVKTADSGTGNKQTLQERYEETKEAAERYQILQVGLTIVVQDLEHSRYLARPYNIYLNPVVTERLDIERIFAYQSGAVEFLLNHGFRMEAPFCQGIQYLSREEEVLAYRKEKAKSDKQGFTDIIIREDETEAIQFVRRVRGEIDQWVARTIRYPEYLNIMHTPNVTVHALTDGRGLNSYQRRLIHQLVRTDYPNLITITKPGYIQIVPLDIKREEAIRKARSEGFVEKVRKQIGFRWVIEALAGGDIEQIDPMTLLGNSNDEIEWIDTKKVKEDFVRLKARLRDHRAVIVGHNLFTDLVNLYKTFIGKLPEKVEDFLSAMHDLFPGHCRYEIPCYPP